jgi:glycosyltransferase involved in cell wall biosynthesis
MRILLVSHPPLTAELGASQVALNLAAALRARGHDALAWSTEPLPAPARWWNRWRAQRRAIERFVAERGPFDVIDLPAISIGARLAGRARLVARSFQPEQLYFGIDLRSQLRERRHRALLSAAYYGVASLAIHQGWRRASVILCQGKLEYSWMQRRYPHLAPRLRQYVVAPSPADRQELLAVRQARGAAGRGDGTRFLWIGRWAAHKGIDLLLRFVEARAADVPDDVFTVAGCGAAAERDVPADLLRQGRLRIVPSFTRRELPALLAGHDAGLFTSIVEGWGLCLNEMLESGLTVYATPAGGVRDLEPFWGSRLRPFPPPAAAPAAAPDTGGAGEDLAAYLAHFSWPEIARRYAEEVLS